MGQNHRCAPLIGKCVFLALIATIGRPAYADLKQAKQYLLWKNYGSAVEELRPLAKSGDNEATYLLGSLYEEGLGVARDYEQAVTLYREAAEKGLAEAQTS